MNIIKVNKDSFINHRDLTDQLFEELLISLEDEYPNFSSWYYNKVVQGISKGERTLLLQMYGSNIIGTAILKHDLQENKICTFRIKKRYRELGLGKKLMRETIDYLDTDKPLITVPENRIKEFYPFLTKFGFKETRIYDKYYNTSINEHSFNGLLVDEKHKNSTKENKILSSLIV